MERRRRFYEAISNLSMLKGPIFHKDQCTQWPSTSEKCTINKKCFEGVVEVDIIDMVVG